ncbi:F-box/kelch-repeat protein OR23-like isoform X2 [Macadamia integrifolia]|uniref:F-box/kelch-repeat protein OR23-like isoform X2 n=1 Tax=Macadamia integrifolia TaxID=60698 RepID=UPI001C4EC81B|nr:F-box/kelch-repeat protein OR23-like isoform X2 [Macadamia integrifolia]
MFSSSSSYSPSHDETLTLIPGLPYDISSLILTLIPYCHQDRLRVTCKTWRAFFSSKTLLSHRRARLPNSSLSHLLCIFPQDPSLSLPYLFDPRHLAWCPLSLMPCNPHVYGLSNFISVSIGPHLYVIGGSHFDTRSFPIDRPSPSSSIFRFDVSTSSWERLSPMLSPRGSFACAADSNSGQILVAGGGSRHAMFGAAGSRMSSVERYDVEKDEWIALDGLPRFRAGCVGFLVGSGEDREFWVMGGYGESRTISGVFPVDEFYKDGVVLELKKGGKWREIGDMWEEGERSRLGNVVVVDGEEGEVPDIFMLDGTEIFSFGFSYFIRLKEFRMQKDRREKRWDDVGMISPPTGGGRNQVYQEKRHQVFHLVLLHWMESCM